MNRPLSIVLAEAFDSTVHDILVAPQVFKTINNFFYFEASLTEIPYSKAAF